MNLSVLLFENNYDIIDYNRWPVDGIECTQSAMWREDFHPFFLKLFRNINKFTTSLTLGRWFRDNKHYDCAIIPDVFFNANVLKILAKCKKADRYILYYRNRVRPCDVKLIEFAKSNGFILSSYSSEDADEYQMNFIPQFWNRKILSNKTVPVTTDVYFIGLAKNRYEQILEVKELCESSGLKIKFQIISEKKLPYTQSERVPYEQVLLNIMSAKAIVDIVSIDNYGLTLRPLEALMSGRKLITNYKDIIKYDFYMPNKNNIFIIGKDDPAFLNIFVNTPFVANGTTLDRYDSKQWLKEISTLKSNPNVPRK